jgi:hypothetical protein
METYPSSFKAGTFQVVLWAPAVVLTKLFVTLRTGSQPLSVLEGRCTRRKSSITCCWSEGV